jgi:hypothetical protein
VRAAHPSLNIRNDARNGARSRQTQLGKRSLVRSRSLITTNNGEQEVRVQLGTGGPLSTGKGCDRTVIRHTQNLKEHRGLRTHTE